MLKEAFNAVSRLHSRAATLRRLGDVTIETPVRLTPSNYFRFLQGPSQTVIHGREFLIPLDTILGYPIELILFGSPTAGTGKVGNTDGDSNTINFDDDAAAVQTAIRAIAGYDQVTVTGDMDNGFLVVFVNLPSPVTALNLSDNHFTGANFSHEWTTSYQKWSPILKRGDKLIDANFGNMAIDEIVEIPDLGGDTMGYRVRCE